MCSEGRIHLRLGVSKECVRSSENSPREASGNFAWLLPPAPYHLIPPLLYLALGTPPWKFKEVLEIPNLLGFPVPPWNSNTTQKSKEVWEFQGYQLISSFLGIPIPHGNSHTCKNLIKRGIGFPRRVWEIQGDRCLWTSGDT